MTPTTMPRSRTRQAGLRSRLALSTLLVVLMAACGTAGGNPPGTTNPSESTDSTGSGDPVADGDPILAFYQCLRDNGLDVADPQPGQTIGITGVDGEDPEVQAVIRDCSEAHLGNTSGRITVGGGAFGENMAGADSLLAFVDCMRSEGIDMPDPEPDGRVPLPDGFDPSNPGSEFQSAVRECARHLDGGIRIGSGEGGGFAGRGQP